MEQKTFEYRKLAEDREEIRLIRILPPNKWSGDTAGASYPRKSTWNRLQDRLRRRQPDDELVRCELSYVSLLEVSDKARKHRRRVRKRGRSSPRDPFESWYDAYEDDTTEPVESWDITTPCYRYKWGDFMALSYAWTDPKLTNDAYIMLDGQRVKVQPNLELALRALRARQQDSRDPPRFWIDALCINQSNIDERSKQVRRMDKIFGGCYSVVVWAGREEDESGRVLHLVDAVNKEMPSWHPDTAAGLVAKFRQNPDYAGEGAWKAFYQFLHRPYWSRLWILQELAVCNDRTPVLCGKDSIPWRRLIRVVNLVNSDLATMEDLIKRDLGRSIEVDVDNTIRHRINRLLDLSRIVTPNTVRNDKSTPLDIMSLATKSKTKDDRDRVYGVLSMIDVDVQSRLTPNYRISVEENYILFCKAYIDAMRDLDILAQSHIHADEKLPSWVPDWRAPPQWRNIARRKRTYAYAACGKGRPPSQHFFSDERCLIAKGVKFDIIDGHSAVFESQLGPVQPVSTKNIYVSEENARDAINRTLCGERTFKEEIYTEDGYHPLDIPWAVSDLDGLAFSNLSISNVQESFNRLVHTKQPPKKADKLPTIYVEGSNDGSDGETSMDHMLNSVHSDLGRSNPDVKANPWRKLLQQPGYDDFKEFRHRNRHQLLFGRELQSYFPRSSRDAAPGRTGDAIRTFQQSWNTLYARLLVTTTKGYVGVVPNIAKSGDVIAVLVGCSVPLVLRPKGDKFLLVGECYVHGIMEGQVMKLVDAKKCQLEDITIS